MSIYFKRSMLMGITPYFESTCKKYVISKFKNGFSCYFKGKLFYVAPTEKMAMELCDKHEEEQSLV